MLHVLVRFILVLVIGTTLCYALLPSIGAFFSLGLMYLVIMFAIFTLHWVGDEEENER